MCAFFKVGLSNNFVPHVVMQALDQGSWHHKYNLPTCADYQAKSVIGCEGSGTYNAAVWGRDLGQCMGLYVKETCLIPMN